MDNRPIGVFDSGVGGIVVLKELRKQLPQESFIYLGDNKQFPYGAKSKEVIIELTKVGIEFLIKKDVKAIVIACGTATSQALEEVKEQYSIPIIGIIEPTVTYLKEKEIKNIGVIATAGTIRSKGCNHEILKQIPDAQIQSTACPLLAPMVEEGWTENKVAKLTVKEYLKDMKKIDVLILGCTHYPLLEKAIHKCLNKKVELINTGTYIAKQLTQILLEKGLLQDSTNKTGNIEIYLTDVHANSRELIPKLLQEELEIKLVV